MRKNIRFQSRIILKLFAVTVLLSILLQTQHSLANGSFLKGRLIEDDTPWKISARSLTYDMGKESYMAEGDVVIEKRDQNIRAQKAVYNVTTGKAVLTGDVYLEAGGDILTGDKAFIDLNSQTGKIINGRLFLRENHFYVSGDVMEKFEGDTYLVKDCILTTCDGKNPDWAISGSEVKVTIEGYGTVKHASVRARGMPLFYVPYMIFPAKTKRQSGLLPPRLGYSHMNGADIELPFFWAISDQTDATLYQRYMSKRGYMQGVELRYIAAPDSKGILLFDILKDKEKEKDMYNEYYSDLSQYERTNQTRYWVRGRADHEISNSINARLDIDFVSDQDFLKEFDKGLFGFESRQDLEKESNRPVEDKRSPARRSALRLSHDGEEYSLQAMASYYQRPENPPEDTRAQSLAGMDFAVLPRQLWKSPLFFSLESDYDYIWREEGQRGNRLSLSPKVSYPLWLFGSYLEFEPSFRYIINPQWLHNPDKEGEYDFNHQTMKAYEIGGRLSASADRVYDFGWMGASKIRHKLSPVIGYTYRVHQNEKDDTPWFEAIDRNGSLNEISFSIENFLDARSENKNGRVTYRQWATFKLIQGYDITEARKEEGEKEPFTPLKATFTLNPFANLDFSGSVWWDHYENRVSTTNLSLDLIVNRSGGRHDTYIVDYIYRTEREKTLDLFADINLAYGLSIGTSIQRDMELGRSISNSYWIGYKSQCWGIKLGMTKEYDDTSILVVVNLLGLGQFGDQPEAPSH
ncbi:MAG TPA: LPS assembly protein LptD [Desulfobacteraceae bacterium]|nr:LPS assembly protein LptD [Desulfobacteraceae bacterium]HPQ28571.1 LPS assembly protein LptD [Desulfobacteraceae bacterium]